MSALEIVGGTPVVPASQVLTLNQLFNRSVRIQSQHAEKEAHKRANDYLLVRVDDTTVATACGNAIVLLDMSAAASSGTQSRVILGRDGGGIGGFAVHPSRSHVAVAGKASSYTCSCAAGTCTCLRPRVSVYTYPALALAHTLADGTDAYFNDAAFSGDGRFLVTVGGAPDHTLCVWDWAAQRVLLRTKAFAQDVFRARFISNAAGSATGEGRIITSGVGHIRFWKLASTFTGLKLQGEIGKFGRVDISDIRDFISLNEGLCVSTSESGHLLVWEGHMIKVQVGRFLRPASDLEVPSTARSGASEVNALPDASLCAPAHEGSINAIACVYDMGVMLTAGDDAMLRWWNMREIEAADHTDGMPIPCVNTLCEADLTSVPGVARGATRVCVRALTHLSSAEDTEAAPETTRPTSAVSSASSTSVVKARVCTWVAMCDSGAVLRIKARVTTTARKHSTHAVVSLLEITPLASGHAGPPSSLAYLPKHGVMASGAADGTLCVWAPNIGIAPISTARFMHVDTGESVGITALAPCGADALWAGFNDGVVRVATYTHARVQYPESTDDPHGLAMAGWHLMAVSKPHSTPVLAIAHSDDGSHTAVAASSSVAVYTVTYSASQSATLTVRCFLRSTPSPLTAALGLPPSSSANIPIHACVWAPASSASTRILYLGVTDGAPVRVVTFAGDAGEPTSTQEVHIRLTAKRPAPPPPPSNIPPAEGDPPPPTEIVSETYATGCSSLAVVRAGEGHTVMCALDGPSTAHLTVQVRIPPVLTQRIIPGSDVSDALARVIASGVRSAGMLEPLTVHTHADARSTHASIPRVTSMSVATVAGASAPIVMSALSDGVVLLRMEGVALRIAGHDAARGAAACVAWTAPDGALHVTTAGRDAALADFICDLPRWTNAIAGMSAAALERSAALAPIDLTFPDAARTHDDTALPAVPAHLECPPPQTLPAKDVTEAGSALAIPAAMDITTSTAYTVEQSRAHTDADARAAAAAVQVARQRAHIAALRDGFAALRARTRAACAAAPGLKFSREDMALDAHTIVHTREVGAARLEEVHAVYAHTLAVKRAQVSKLVNRFTADLECDRQAVHAVERPSLCVHTLRTQCDADDADIGGGAGRDGVSAQLADASNAQITAATGDTNPAGSDATAAGGDEGDDGDEGTGSAASFELRRRARTQRKAALAALYGRRPGPTHEYAPDVAAVAHARTHMGDHTLKRSREYTPRENARMDVPSQRAYMQRLHTHIYTLRSGFNDRVRASATVRERLIETLQGVYKEVNTCEAALRTGWAARALARAGVALELAPETTAPPLESSTLGRTLADITRAHSSAGLREVDQGTSGSSSLPLSLDPYASVLPLIRTPANLRVYAENLGASAHESAEPLSGAHTNEEVQSAGTHAALLTSRITWLKSVAVSSVRAFDAHIAALARERVRVVCECAAVRARLAVCAAEMTVLKDVDVRDTALTAKRMKVQADKAAVSSALASHTATLSEKRAELDALQARERVLFTELEELVGSSSPSYPALLRIFKRKLKRRRVDAGAQRDDDDDMSDDEDDGDSGDGDSSGDDDDGVTAPEGVDVNTWTRVLALRDRRQALDETVAEVNKAADDVRRGMDRYIAREKAIDKETASLAAETAAFGREKQARLNMCPATYTLTASQVCVGLQPPAFKPSLPAEAAANIVPPYAWPSPDAPLGYLPHSLAHACVFTRTRLRALRARIHTLTDECGQQESAHTHLHKDEAALVSDKRALEGAISAARDKANELQLLKFGRVIDVDALDRAMSVSTSTNTSAAETGVVVAQAQDAEIAMKRAAVTADEMTLLALTREHTRVCEETAALRARVAVLEATLGGHAQRAADVHALASALGATAAPAPRAAARASQTGSTTAAGGIVLLNSTALARTLTSTLRGGGTARVKTRGQAHVHISDASVGAAKETAERGVLMTTVGEQAREIEMLRAQIQALRHKGGVIYMGPSTAATGSGTDTAAMQQQAPMSGTI